MAQVGAGACGLRSSGHLSALGYHVVIVDNLSRGNIDNELDANSLLPIKPMGGRTQAWFELAGRNIEVCNFHINNNYPRMAGILSRYPASTRLPHSAPVEAGSVTHSLMSTGSCWRL
jgi:UDP-sulfoquinovose synthase